MEELVIKIQDRSNNILETLGFSGEAIVSKRNSAYFINFIVDDSPAFLIGRGGEALDALQHVIRILLRGEGFPLGYTLIVDVNGYRNKKASMLEKTAREVAHRVRSKGKEEVLPPMNSFERRVIHTLISNIADVESESIGERDERRVVIKPKKK